ncbi:MAG: DUF4625 domain-containing protein [Prevotella sp.]|nr:DUF4625 domain-containing protein [Prevotella sp.]
MKKFKFISLMMAILSTLALGFTACDDDDEDNSLAPVIELDEANIEGNELCTEADIVAQGLTASIVINIYDSTGKTQKVNFPVTNSKYINVRNIDDFHVHVDITNKNVVKGDLLKLTVVDASGRSTTAQKRITEDADDFDDYDH